MEASCVTPPQPPSIVCRLQRRSAGLPDASAGALPIAASGSSGSARRASARARGTIPRRLPLHAPVPEAGAPCRWRPTQQQHRRDAGLLDCCEEDYETRTSSCIACKRCRFPALPAPSPCSDARLPSLGPNLRPAVACLAQVLQAAPQLQAVEVLGLSPAGRDTLLAAWLAAQQHRGQEGHWVETPDGGARFALSDE